MDENLRVPPRFSPLTRGSLFLAPLLWEPRLVIQGGNAIVAPRGEEVGSMGAMLMVVTTSIINISITKMELEENIGSKELTPAELSKEMVRKAVQVAPALSTASVDKKLRGHRRTYAAPKAEETQTIGVSTMTLYNAKQHVADIEKYPELAATGSTEVVAHSAAT